jgi:hypothetical protein
MLRLTYSLAYFGLDVNDLSGSEIIFLNEDRKIPNFNSQI